MNEPPFTAFDMQLRTPGGIYHVITDTVIPARTQERGGGWGTFRKE